MSLDPREVQSLIKEVAGSNVEVFHYVTSGMELYVSKRADVAAYAPERRPPPADEAVVTPEPPAAVEPASPAEPSGAATGTVVESPMIGVFYAAPEPGAEPFVRVGSRVEESDTVGLVEAMKLFTAVTAGCSGQITRVLVDNGDYVEYGQPLFEIAP